MQAISDAVASAESEEIAVASALAVLRLRLGWNADSEARTEAITHFGPVALALFQAAKLPEHEPAMYASGEGRLARAWPGSEAALLGLSLRA
ncbi:MULTISPECIES: hypothetical protein [unclassified Mesorhizobium]|uniref:hypothetical protein n=1 Tax=unclassified Mesorhizobium TaxID=325217 RepID=UPI0033366650